MVIEIRYQLKLIFLYTMQVTKFKCSNHPANQISFLCTVNQWHFIPLCNDCVPSHTQNHPKNFKITLESYLNVQSKTTSTAKSAAQQYQVRLAVINDYLNSNKQRQSDLILENLRKELIDLVNSHIDQMKKSIKQKHAQTIQFQQSLLTKLKENVQADIKDYEQIENIQQISQWSEMARRLYFKDGIKPYLQQIDDILKQHEQRVYRKKDLPEINGKKIQQQLKKLLQTHIYSEKQVGNNNQQKVKPSKDLKQAKKQPKIVIKPKICKVCNSELEYLTPLKKHLICKNCGKQERNYIPKKQ